MKYRKFKGNKLWRDKAVTFYENIGSIINYKILSDAEYANELKTKFMEEANEVCNAKSKKELIEELADIMEVISCFCDVNNFTLEDILEVQKKKHEERGGFKGRKFVITAEHEVGSHGEKYCLNDPEKYPEIFE